MFKIQIQEGRETGSGMLLVYDIQLVNIWLMDSSHYRMPGYLQISEDSNRYQKTPADARKYANPYKSSSSRRYRIICQRIGFELKQTKLREPSKGTKNFDLASAFGTVPSGRRSVAVLIFSVTGMD